MWVAAAALLVLGPLVFNLARAPSFEATHALFPQRVPPYPAIKDPSYYRSLLDDPTLREQMNLNLGRSATDYDDIQIRRRGRTAPLVVTAEAGTPVEAQRIVNALAPQISGATQRSLGVRAARDAATTRERLRSAASRSERRVLRIRLRRLEMIETPPATQILPGARARRPPIERWADRLVNDLPGDFRARPSPLWAALAGLLVAALLWGMCLLLVPPGGGQSQTH